MTVETYKQYKEKVEAASNIIFQMKQRFNWLAIAIILCQINKGHYYLAIAYVEEVTHVSS